ncbi:MAG: DUF2238 domain-containing protein [Planctomycetota bacterium]|nr:DUF2238 domain-containing protein [Planctomycetota bacterium]
MRLRIALLTVLIALAILLGIRPLDRSDWILENVLIVLGLAFLWRTRNWLPLTDASVWLVFVFLVLHEVGAHYTYACVPYDRWFESLSGRTLNSVLGLERNHYDRLVHFLFGFLLAIPQRELFLRVVRARGIASYWLPVQMTLSWSAIYEIVEWLSAEFFGGELGAAFLGTQGDEWDAQKDMALAGLGAVLSMCVLAAIHRRRGYDFQQRWLELRVPDFARRFD